MSKAQVQENARAWANEPGVVGLGRLAELAVQGNSPAFRRELAAEGYNDPDGRIGRAAEGIESEADYVDNWLERENYFGPYDNRTNPYAQLGMNGGV